MPYLELTTRAQPASDAARDALLTELGALVSEHLGKSSAYVMTSLVTPFAMHFADAAEPACFVSVRAVGMTSPAQRQALGAAVAAHLEASLGVPEGRTFVVFGDVPGDHWSFGGRLLG